MNAIKRTFSDGLKEVSRHILANIVGCINVNKNKKRELIFFTFSKKYSLMLLVNFWQ